MTPVRCIVWTSGGTTLALPRNVLLASVSGVVITQSASQENT